MAKIRYVDFDRTLAYYHKWTGATSLGEPVPKMLSKVKRWLAQGDEVVIFTARISAQQYSLTKPEEVEPAKKAIEEWCVKHLGRKLQVTCEKGVFNVLYDDRAHHILENTGETIEELLLDHIDTKKEAGWDPVRLVHSLEHILEDRIKRQNY